MENPIYYNVTKKDCLLMIFLLSLCGNVFVSAYVPPYIYVLLVALFCFRLSLNRNYEKIIDPSLVEGVKVLSLAYVFLFVLQYITFGWNTLPGLINHLAKLFVGFFFLALFGERFRGTLFNAMYYLSLISLPLWVFQFTTGHGIPGLEWKLGKTILVYSYRQTADIVRNCGFFWEPGAMGGYIVFTLLLFFNDLEALYKFNKKKCIVILLTLLSTQSSGAYVCFGMLIIVYLLFSMKSRLRYLLLPIVVIGGAYIYQNAEFLSQKIEHQNEEASEQKIGEFSSTRVGSLMFDLHYIQKHPLIGNGLHERTRLADHPYLVDMFKRGDVAAMGNGFTDQIAKWGGLYMVAFCFVFFRTNYSLEKKKKVCMLLLLALLLQGEAFMNFPLFLVFPLIRVDQTDSRFYFLT